jgi:phosphate starvation-inducible protein PhoH and related proteins
MAKRKNKSTEQRHEVYKAPLSKPKFKPLHEEQKNAYELCTQNYITFLTGPAGTSKTFTAIAFAVDLFLRGEVEKIVLTRPAVEACGESIGFVPGTAEEKLAGFLVPLHDCLAEYAGQHLAEITQSLSIVPLGYMRGRTLKHSAVVLDEAQNANLKQLEMLTTRLGTGTRMVLCGDAAQADISRTPLVRAASRLSEVYGIGHFRFTMAAAVIRHPLTPQIISAFEDLHAYT